MKGKKSKTTQPNAPHLEHLLYANNNNNNSLAQQPPHNPYYPDPSNSSFSYPSPPAYSDLTPASSRPIAVPLAQMSSTQIHYPRAMTSETPTAVIVNSHSTMTRQDLRRVKYSHQARKFGCELILVAILIIGFSQVVLNLDKARHCPNYVIQKFSNENILKFEDLKEINISLRSVGITLLILGVLKLLFNYSGSCLIGFIIGCVSLFGTCISAALCYYAFYSPCYIGLQETTQQFVKSITSLLADRIPGPESGIFGERNVIQTVQQDPNGVYIFGLDLGIFIMFISTFFAGLA